MSLGFNSDCDLHILTSYDGRKFYFPDDEQVFMSYGNYGMPPIEYQTRRGYKQDGATVLDYQLGVRAMTVNLVQGGRCTRKKYWQYRDSLIDFLRPNRGGPLTLELRRAGNTRRAITVYADGPQFAPESPDTNHFDIDETITLTAYDPIWYDPTQNTVSFNGVAASQLVFPATFPISFSPDGVTFTTNVTYTGTYVSYPVITITAPYNSCLIENVTTGVRFSFNIPLTSGQRIVTLTPGSQSIVDASGVDKFSELADDSNLVDFNLRPSPQVSGGTNQLRATMTGASIGTSAFSVRYFTKYIGI